MDSLEPAPLTAFPGRLHVLALGSLIGASEVGYNCVVCAKQVPDTKRITGSAMKDDGTVNRAALPAIFNPEDLKALEEQR